MSTRGVQKARLRENWVAREAHLGAESMLPVYLFWSMLPRFWTVAIWIIWHVGCKFSAQTEDATSNTGMHTCMQQHGWWWVGVEKNWLAGPMPTFQELAALKNRLHLAK